MQFPLSCSLLKISVEFTNVLLFWFQISFTVLSPFLEKLDKIIAFRLYLIFELPNICCSNIFSVYGDPAYPLGDGYIIPPYRGGAISRNQMIFNKRMSAVRICVEWAFGKVLSLFAYLDFKKNQKVYLQPVGKYYAVAVLLTNCHTCMYGSETSSFFNLQPPALLEYLRGWRWIEFMHFEFSNCNRSYYCCMRLYLSIY